MDSLPENAGAGPAAVLSRFRAGFRACLGARADELCELADAVLCGEGPVRTLAALSLAPEHRRGHGALYDAVNQGRISVGRLRRVLAGLPLPRAADGRLMLAVDVSNWLRPGAATSPGRLFCHVYERGKGQAQMIPGWPYSVIVALEPGRTSWTAVLDAVRLGPDDDMIAVTAAQVRDVIARLIEAGHWRQGDPDVLVIFDAGYDAARLAYLLADLPAQVLGRLRSDRVMQVPAPPHQPAALGRPRKHGGQLALSDPGTWPAPQVTTTTVTSRYGTAIAAAWDRVHSRLTHRAAWLDHDGPLPVIDGTLIRLQAGHLPGDRDPKPMWLWWSSTSALPADVDMCWQAFLRRFDLEHTFRLFKQVLGWTAPKIRDPAAAGRWTWLVITCHAQLRLARPLAADLRHPWERPPRRTGSPQPASGGDSGTSARPCHAWPVHPNPASPGLAARPARRTAAPHTTTTSGKPLKENATSRPNANPQVKQQDESRESSLRAMEGIYRGLESKFAATMDARAEWEHNTERSRHQALAAHAEYMRRHPDAKLEPLRSAEPPRPSEEERAELERSTRSEPAGQRETGRSDGAGAGEQPERERKPEREERAEARPEHEKLKPERETQAEPETPAWVTELAERNRAAMAKIEEYRGLRVPSEDHEGEAWPQAGRLERDAVLQPPQPEIQPRPRGHRTGRTDGWRGPRGRRMTVP